MPEEFSFCVGRPWEKESDGIRVYAYGTQVHHGTLEYAQGFRQYVEEQTGEEHFIYRLAQVEEKREPLNLRKKDPMDEFLIPEEE